MGDYRGIARIYDRLFASMNRGLSLVGLRLHRPAAGARVLDLCCGTGSQLELYQRHGALLHGLDASPAMLAVARRRFADRASLCRGDAARLPYVDGVYDLVTCTLALHEMRPPAQLALVSEAARVLKPSGRLILIDFHTGPYAPIGGWLSRSLAVVIEFLAGWEHFRNQLAFIAAGGLPALARARGLRIEKQVTLAGGVFAVLCLEVP